MEKIRRILYSLLAFIFSGCFSARIPANSFSIVNWNVQTFFDGNCDGTEYSNFTKSQIWGNKNLSLFFFTLYDTESFFTI